uniref:hypothetical protein n=1 Tax=Actinotalea sp. C106 TaxID=2908644 RepID=UPI0020291282
MRWHVHGSDDASLGTDHDAGLAPTAEAIAVHVALAAELLDAHGAAVHLTPTARRLVGRPEVSRGARSLELTALLERATQGHGAA